MKCTWDRGWVRKGPEKYGNGGTTVPDTTDGVNIWD